MRKFNIKRKKILVMMFALLLGAALIYSPLGMSWQTQAAGTITGRVFQDYNANGLFDNTGGTTAVDRGLAGVTVTAYDSAGANQGSATTATDGTYSLDATGTGPYRLEFTNLPTGYFPSARSTDSVNGGTATNAGSTVQFVTDGDTSNVNLAINRPTDFCQNNPELVTTCFVGTVTSDTSSDPVLISFPYSSGTTDNTTGTGVTNPTTHTLAVPQSAVGAVWGIAQHRSSQQVFTSAFTKRHAGFRNDSAGATGEIFISDRSGSNVSVFLNLNTLFGSNVAGANPHDVGNYFNDLSAFDAVGKTAFGDIDISQDEQTLYVVNLNDRNLYAIPLGSGAPTAPTSSAQVATYDLVGLANNTSCANADLRPGALKVYNGSLYYGLTCTAQSTQNAGQLAVFVYRLDLGAGTATAVASTGLGFARGCITFDGVNPCPTAEWNPWTASTGDIQTYASQNQFFYPQPWLSDIEFDENNFMIIGIADRAGHQLGSDNNLSDPNEPVEGVSAGATLRFSPNGAVWSIENNGSDGTNTTAGAGNGQGPGGGEFYYLDGYTVPNGETHAEISLGGLLVVPGYQDVLISAFDPAPTSSADGISTVRSGGVIWLNNKTSDRSRSYQLYSVDDTDTGNAFGKAAGIGDIEAFCNAAPIEIGNRIWNDANSNGVQDPGENGIAGVTVRLYKNDVLLATAVTDANGEYYFVGGTAVDPNHEQII